MLKCEGVGNQSLSGGESDFDHSACLDQWTNDGWGQGSGDQRNILLILNYQQNLLLIQKLIKYILPITYKTIDRTKIISLERYNTDFLCVFKKFASGLAFHESNNLLTHHNALHYFFFYCGKIYVT